MLSTTEVPGHRVNGPRRGTERDELPMRPQRTCSLSDCNRVHYARNYCKRHYLRWNRYGDPRLARNPETVEGKFWAKVRRTVGCWTWQGYVRRRDGYAGFKWNGKTGAAYRFSYELHNGPIPDGLQIDHLCRNRACVRPDHLEAVTGAINVARGVRLVRTCECGRDVLGNAYFMHRRACRRLRELGET